MGERVPDVLGRDVVLVVLTVIEARLGGVASRPLGTCKTCASSN